MNKNESKYFNTAILFDEALISLLETKDFEYITIKEICNKAGINRSTFYLHYESINDLVEETMTYINNKFINYFNENTLNFINKINESNLDELKLVQEKYLTPYLTFVKDNKTLFKASFNNPRGMYALERYNSLKENIFIPILIRFGVNKNEQDYIITFYISGIISIIKEWINRDCEESIQYIEDIIIRCVDMN